MCNLLKKILKTKYYWTLDFDLSVSSSVLKILQLLFTTITAVILVTAIKTAITMKLHYLLDTPLVIKYASEYVTKSN